MAARTGEEFLKGLVTRPRWVSMDGRLIDDVAADPLTMGAARTLAGVFDRQHEFPDDCLIADDETGEPINISHMHPRSIEDLRKRAKGLSRISEYTAGLMGRTPDYMNMKFVSFAATHKDWAGAERTNERGEQNLVNFQKHLRRDDVSLTHTIIQPNNDKRTDANPNTYEMLGEILSYVEVTRSAILASTEEGYDIGTGVYFPGGRALTPMRSLLAVWFPRVNEIITMLGSHNLIATPSLALLQDPDARPLIDVYMCGADGTSAVERAAIFRLAWDFVGSSLGGRNALYERFYLTSAASNRQRSHVFNTDRSRSNELVDSILRAGRELTGGR